MKILRHIPNTITCLNLFCGTVALTFVFKGQPQVAFYWMIASVICDFLDGFTARALKAYSSWGKELDSFADLISFGLVPGALLYVTYATVAPCPWMAYFPFIVTVFSALRLTKFNLDTRQTQEFIGLATPANALLIASMMLYADHAPAWSALLHTTWAIPCLSLVLSLLMVSELPMFSLKFKSFGFGENKYRYLFLASIAVWALVCLLLHGPWSLLLLAIMGTYLLINAFRRLLG